MQALSCRYLWSLFATWVLPFQLVVVCRSNLNAVMIFDLELDRLVLTVGVYVSLYLWECVFGRVFSDGCGSLSMCAFVCFVVTVVVCIGLRGLFCTFFSYSCILWSY